MLPSQQSWFSRRDRFLRWQMTTNASLGNCASSADGPADAAHGASTSKYLASAALIKPQDSTHPASITSHAHLPKRRPVTFGASKPCVSTTTRTLEMVTRAVDACIQHASIACASLSENEIRNKMDRDGGPGGSSHEWQHHSLLVRPSILRSPLVIPPLLRAGPCLPLSARRSYWRGPSMMPTLRASWMTFFTTISALRAK